MRAAAAMIALLAAFAAAAQDFERERRWEAEVVPGLVVGEAIKLRNASGREFLALLTEVPAAKGAVVLAHGRNVHPDHAVIGELRVRLADLGYTTLSIQLPVLGADAQRPEDYPPIFPEAIDRLGAAARWLSERGERRIALVSHSMGSWMANEYFDAQRASPYRAWVCIGLTGGYSWATYRSARPILDVYGAEDLPAVLDAAWRRRLTIAAAPEGSRQVELAGADHFHSGRTGELAATIAQWLDAVLR